MPIKAFNFRKILTASAFVLVQGVLLYFFYLNQYPILNFRFSYFTKVYMPVIVHSIEEKIQNFIFPQPVLSLTHTVRFERSVPVLLYHGSIEQADSTNISLDNFREHMFALKKAGYQTITMEDLQLFMEGKKKLPEKSFLLTFDDGRKDSFYPADPILKSLGYSAVMFVITGESLGTQESPFHLSENELKYMLQTGRWEIESHSQNAHRTYPIDELGNSGIFLSNKLWISELSRLETDKEFEERIAEDFLVSKNLLQDTLGIQVNSFAYPFGDYGQGSINYPGAQDVVAKWTNSVYRFTFREVGLPNAIRNYADPHATMIDRIDVKPEWTGEYLVSLLENSNDKPIPYEDLFTSDHGWISLAGKVSVANSALVMSTVSDGNSTGGVLEGTSAWDSYRMSVHIEQASGSAISLIGRYSEKGSLYCVFRQNGVSIEEHRSTGTTVLTQQSADLSSEWGNNMNLGMDVTDTRVNCLVNGKNITAAETTTNPLLNRGRVGIAQTGSGSITVSKLRVDDLSLVSPL